MDTLDPRDLQTRLEELQPPWNEIQSKVNVLEQKIRKIQDKIDELEEGFGQDEREELQELEEMENISSGWEYGNPFIPKADFVEYCEGMVRDIGDLPRDIPGYIEIDWDSTADNIRIDYSEIEYRGTTYLYRSG